MSASFFNLKKYAATGIASPQMTVYDKLKALSMFGDSYPISTITGLSPISFLSDGTPLTAYSIIGNEQQTGTPTPDAQIVPEECGDKTGNLFDASVYTESSIYKSNCTVSVSGGNLQITATGSDPYVGEVYSSGNVISTLARGSLIEILPNTTYTISTRQNKCYVTVCDASFVSLFSQKMPATSDYTSFSFTTPNNAKYVLFRFGNNALSVGESYTFENIMLNTGSTALPYEPYGYKIPVTVSGTTYPIYLSEPIRKIGDYADVLDSSGTVTRRIRKLVLTGEETIENPGTGYGQNPYFRIDVGAPIVSDCGLCSHWEKSIISASTSNVGFDTLYSSSYGRYYIAFRDSTITTLEAFKQFLADEYAAGHPVTVWYVLAAPQTETITCPTITPSAGSNTLTVGTTLAPSGVSITGKIKEV